MISTPAKVIQRVCEWLLAVVLLGLGFFFVGKSLRQLQQLRQLERLPETPIAAALPGDVHIVGTVILKNGNLSAPASRTVCAYFSYIEEHRNSKHEWSRVSSSAEAAAFRIRDSTGEIEVAPSGNVEFEAPLCYEDERGDYRYSERRIDPGQTVHVFGHIEPFSNGLKVTFNAGAGSPAIISGFDGRTELVRKARGSLLWSLAGLACLTFAVYGLCYNLGIHQLLVYLTLLTSVQMAVLGGIGMRIAWMDLKAMQNQLRQKEQAAMEFTRASLQSAGVEWNGNWESLGDFNEPSFSAVSEADGTRLNAIRINLAQTRLRIQHQMQRFSQRWIGRLAGVRAPDEIPLPESQRQVLLAQESAFVPVRTLPFSMFWSSAAAAIALLATPFLIWWGIREIRFKRFIENVPTSAVAGVAFGLTELDGFTDTVDGQEALSGPLSGEQCIYYRYRVMERRGSGKNSSWVTVQDDRCEQPFRCTDGSNYIEIDPEGADFICRTLTTERENQIQREEWRIELGDRIYALGHAAIDPNTGDSLRLEKPEEKSLPFILSNFSESQVMREIARKGILSLTGAFLLLTLAGLVWSGMTGSFGASNYFAVAAVGPALLVLAALVLYYNDLVFLRQRACRNWANIEVSLNKRQDLIPNLEAVAAGFLAHERSIQEQVATMRRLLEAGTPAEPKAASDYLEVERSLRQELIALQESNPQLLASSEMTALAQHLTTVENEVALMRKGYNNAVEIYNARIQQFPDLILAALAGFKPLEFLACDIEVAATVN